jgi:predicted ATPase
MGALAPVPRICGREAEIQALGEALDRVAAGGPAIVLVEGEAGIGKTRLLTEILEDARGRGMRVAAGGAEELERREAASCVCPAALTRQRGRPLD